MRRGHLHSPSPAFFAAALFAVLPAHATEPAATDVARPWLHVVHADLPAHAAWERIVAREGPPPQRPTFANFTLPDGPHAGTWDFDGGPGDTQARTAWHQTVSDQPPYAVHVTLYCDDIAGDCAPLRERLATFKAPYPPTPALAAEWRTIVSNEPCTPGEVSMPPPEAPPHAFTGRERAEVRIGITINRCGEVRHAWVAAPSGVTLFDRRAIAAAKRWRVPPPADGARIADAAVPVSLRFDPFEE